MLLRNQTPIIHAACEDLKEIAFKFGNNFALEHYTYTPVNFENIMRLPKDMKVTLIQTANNIDLLDSLIGAPIIGIDSEWFPKIYHEDPFRPSLL